MSVVTQSGLTAVAKLAVLGTADHAALREAFAQWGCDIFLIATDADAGYTEQSRLSAQKHRSDLLEMGLPPEKVHVVSAISQLVGVDLVLNLRGYGDLWAARSLPQILGPLLQAGTVLISDIRKGSGAIPLLREFGEIRVIETQNQLSTPSRRVIMTSHKQTPTEAGNWSQIAQGLAGPDGFYREQSQHSLLYVPRSKVLVVTFDNLDIAMTKREDRRPWGFSFIEQQGWSMLGVMAQGWTWFRDDWLINQFTHLRDSGFFAQFDRVVFYGASMGGYGAAAYSAFCPGADVVAISPQSTLDRTVVPWETRYRKAWERDFTGPYGDAAVASTTAARVFLFYDPYEPLDRGHADRFLGANVVRLRAPLLGHRLGSSLHQMGILAPITLAALEGRLTEADFYRLLRARKTSPRYQRELFKRALVKGRPALARRLGTWVLARDKHRYIRRAMEEL